MSAIEPARAVSTAVSGSGGRAASRLFFWTGIVTMLPGLQFILPVQVLHLLGLEVSDPAGMFYARHWALMALCFGALLVHAARQPRDRRAIVLAAMVEKLGLACLVGLSWTDPALAGLHGAAGVDGICGLAYMAWLWRGAPARRQFGDGSR